MPQYNKTCNNFLFQGEGEECIQVEFSSIHIKLPPPNLWFILVILDQSWLNKGFWHKIWHEIGYKKKDLDHNGSHYFHSIIEMYIHVQIFFATLIQEWSSTYYVSWTKQYPLYFQGISVSKHTSKFGLERMWKNEVEAVPCVSPYPCSLTCAHSVYWALIVRNYQQVFRWPIEPVFKIY